LEQAIIHSAKKPMKVSEGSISRIAEMQQLGNGLRTPASNGPLLIMSVHIRERDIPVELVI
jgi:hypothetical protein